MGTDLRSGGTIINANFTELYAIQSRTINAADNAYAAGVGNEGKIQLAINDAAGTGARRVKVPQFMLPYNAAAITFNTSVQMVREGGAENVYDVLAYGAWGNFSTNDSPSFQAAINGAKAALGGVIAIPQPSIQYLLQTSLDCTLGVGLTSPALHFRADASDNVNRTLIYAQHTGHVFDLAGATDYVFDNVSIQGDQFTQPITAYFMARNSAASGAGRHVFNNCREIGYFSESSIFLYGSEENEWNGGYHVNYTPNADVVVLTSYNNANTPGAGMVSSFLTIATGTQSQYAANFRGGSWWAAGGTTGTGANVFHLDGAHGVNGTELWVYAAQSNANGNALVYVNTKNSSSNSCRFTKIDGELGTFYQNYGVKFEGSAGSVTCSGWVIEDWQIPTNTFAVYGDNNCTLDASRIDGLIEPATKGVSLQTFNSSSLRGVNTAVAIRGSMDKSVLHGMSAVWTIAAKTNYVLIDMFTGRVETSTAYKGTFTPTLVLNATPITSYTTRVGSYTVHDDRVFFDLYIVVNVKGAGVGTASITGLPITSAAGGNYAVAVKLDGSNLAAGFLSAYVPGGGTTLFIQISTYGSPTSNANLADTNINTGTAIMLNGSYRI